MNDETAPQMTGDYEILGVLGAGGMGKVYKVRNVISDRVEAMKVLLPDLAGQKDLADRFLREIKLLASLSHPNIAALRTAFTSGNQLVMIMEFVEGKTLAAQLQKGPIPVPAAVDYIDQALAALSYAHEQQIIHRDIKPANMMVTPQGVLKLMDFGIAKSAGDRGLTMTGTTLGSLYYMSPEQIKGGTVDERSDLYAVAVSLYEMVTGRRPFQADSNYSIMAAHLEQAPKPPLELQPDMPVALNQLILMGLAKEPGQRFQSANAFRNALKAVRDALAKPAGSAAVPAQQTAAFGATALVAGKPSEAAPAIAAGPVSPPAASSDAATVPYPTSVTGESQGQPQAQTGPSSSGPGASGLAASAPLAPQTPAEAKSRSYRGLYMTLGALIVIIVLALGGLYIPRFAKTRASQAVQQQSGSAAAGTSAPVGAPAQATPQQPPQPTGSGSAAADTAQPVANAGGNSGQTSNAPPAGGTASSTNPAASGGGASQGKGTATNGSDQANGASAAPSNPQPSGAPQSSQSQAGSQGSGGGTAPQPQAAPAGQQANSATLDDLEQQLDALSGRAGSVKDSIDKIRQEQSAQGVNLRSDIAAAEEQMETYMGKAQAALQSQDAARTKRYMDLAEVQVEKLEKFLGR